MIHFIFIGTQMSENLGAAARVMKNFGFSSMRLVNPQCEPISSKAIAMSAGASEILENAVLFKSIHDAIKDLQIVSATAAHTRDMVCHVHTPTSFAKTYNAHHATGILFGPERTGLLNDDIALCAHIIRIPTAPDFSSLNLAQAVAIVAYSCFEHKIKQVLETGESALASQQEIHGLLEHLESELDQANYWRDPRKKTIMWRNLQNFITRISLTTQDTRTLRGILRTLRRDLTKF